MGVAAERRSIFLSDSAQLKVYTGPALAPLQTGKTNEQPRKLFFFTGATRIRNIVGLVRTKNYQRLRGGDRTSRVCNFKRLDQCQLRKLD